MNASRRTVLIVLVFALIAGSLLAVDTDAKRKRRSHHRASKPEIVQLVPDDPFPKSGSDSQFAKLDPNVDLPTINPDVFDPEPDPCDMAESVLDGFLPKTVTLKKTDTYWAKLTVYKGSRSWPAT